MLSEKDKEVVRKKLKEMKDEVTLLLFSQKLNCEYCSETEELMKELDELSPKLNVEIHNAVEEKELAETYGIDEVPAIVIKGKKDFGIRFYGVPAGYEFATLLEDILMISKGVTSLKEETRERVKNINKKLEIRVFVTPTCPYCPSAVMLAHQAAVENDNIVAYGIEVSEYPHIVKRYDISAVPVTVINDTVRFEGAVPEEVFMDYLVKASEIEIT